MTPPLYVDPVPKEDSMTTRIVDLHGMNKVKGDKEYITFNLGGFDFNNSHSYGPKTKEYSKTNLKLKDVRGMLLVDNRMPIEDVADMLKKINHEKRD